MSTSSETRDQEAAEALFRSAVAVTGTTRTRSRLTSTPATRRLLDKVFCDDLEHRTSKYLNIYLEQDHRGVKGRYRPLRGFQTHPSAAPRCRELRDEEVRDFFRPATRRKEHVPHLSATGEACICRGSPPSAGCARRRLDDDLRSPVVCASAGIWRESLTEQYLTLDRAFGGVRHSIGAVSGRIAKSPDITLSGRIGRQTDEPPGYFLHVPSIDPRMPETKRAGTSPFPLHWAASCALINPRPCWPPRHPHPATPSSHRPPDRRSPGSSPQ